MNSQVADRVNYTRLHAPGDVYNFRRFTRVRGLVSQRVPRRYHLSPPHPLPLPPPPPPSASFPPRIRWKFRISCLSRSGRPSCRLLALNQFPVQTLEEAKHREPRDIQRHSEHFIYLIQAPKQCPLRNFDEARRCEEKKFINNWFSWSGDS